MDVTEAFIGPRRVRIHAIPLPNEQTAWLTLPTVMTEDEWALLLDWLTLLRRGATIPAALSGQETTSSPV